MLQLETLLVGPPLPFPFVSAMSLFVTASAKLLEPVGEDLEEEGEQWTKRSSRSLYDDDSEAGDGK